jgi:two-component system, NtrC family, response regulator GlrR
MHPGELNARDLDARQAPIDDVNATVRVGSSAPALASVRRFALLNLTTGVRQELELKRCQIGSHVSNDVVVDSPTVSRFHCEIVVDDQDVSIKDLGSTNGTLVDGVRIAHAFLKQTSLLTLGDTQLRFEIGEHVALHPLPQATAFGTLVGSSSSMRQVFGVLQKAAKSDATVLFEGETGTGKSQAASSVHDASARSGRPFLVVDCGALPASLLEAELFGHEKGAFTGANSRRVGVFEEANGGTVLLDEIGEMPLELQPKLLRVLEDKQVRRIGQNKWTAVDVRILAATHRDLRTEVNQQRFRADLFFRLAVVKVTLPSLREHAEDIAAVAKSLLKTLGASETSHAALFAPEFLSRLKAASWPGNVRELRNYLERCLVFEQAMPMHDAAQATSTDTVSAWMQLSLPEAKRANGDAFEKEYLLQLLERHGGKVAQAAVEAQVDRVYLYRLMRKHAIKAG